MMNGRLIKKTTTIQAAPSSGPQRQPLATMTAMMSATTAKIVNTGSNLPAITTNS